MRQSWFLVAASLCVGLVLSAPEARACTIWQTADGLPLHFKQGQPVTFYIQQDGSADIGDDSELEAIQAGFEGWASADCGGDGPALEFSYGGLLEVAAVNYDPRLFRDEKNMVSFVREGWDGNPDVLARARILWDSQTGEIIEFGIALNDQYADWSTDGAGSPGKFDVQSVVARQIGLVLGLGDSEVEGAVMSPGLDSGSVAKRALAPDDTLAICELYAPGRAYEATPPEDAACAYDLHPGARPPEPGNNGEPSNNGEPGNNGAQNNGEPGNNGQNNGQNNGDANNGEPAPMSLGAGASCEDAAQCAQGLTCGCPFESCQNNICYEPAPANSGDQGAQDEGCATAPGGGQGAAWLGLLLLGLLWRRRR